jgi:predicted nucleic acid-binding protein
MLLDSNILIYAAEPDTARFDSYLQNSNACLASVTRIEVLGFPGFFALDLFRQTRLEELVKTLVELPLDETIGDRAMRCDAKGR